MKTITSTEARQSFSSILLSVSAEPVAILKQDKEIAVILSPDRYKELKKLEDILYGKAAQLAIEEGFASQQKSEDLLNMI